MTTSHADSGPTAVANVSTEKFSKTRLFFKNIPLDWSKFDVYRLFKGYGVINDVILTQSEQSIHARFGFVEMLRASQASKARAALDGLASVRTNAAFPSDLARPLIVQAAHLYANAGKKHGNNVIREAFIRGKCQNADEHTTDKASLEATNEPSGSSNALDAPTVTANSGNLNKVPSRSRIPHRPIYCDPFTPPAVVLPFKSPVGVSLTATEGGHPRRAAVRDPTHFYAQLTANLPALRHFTARLNAAVNAAVRHHPADTGVFTPHIGELVVAQGADGQWMRAAVLKQKTGIDERDVLYFACELLDYGGAETFPADKLRPLSKEFADFPAQAIHCGLYGVVAPKRPLAERAQHGAGAAPWSVDAIAAFLVAVGASRVSSVVATVVGYRGAVKLVTLHTTAHDATQHDTPPVTIRRDVAAYLIEQGACAAEPTSTYAVDGGGKALRPGTVMRRYGRGTMERLRKTVADLAPTEMPEIHSICMKDYCRGLNQQKAGVDDS